MLKPTPSTAGESSPASAPASSSAAAHLGPRLLDRLSTLPVFMCSFRPLFFATALYGLVGLALWAAFLQFGVLLPAVPGGFLVWHGHEMVFGFGMAAVVGFVPTAVPEFTATPALGARVAVVATLAWLAARIAFWLSGTVGVLPAALTNVGFALLPIALVAGRLLGDPDRRHLGFLFGLIALAASSAGFYFDALRGHYPMRWVYLAIGVLMALIVVAMSRISMRIVNDALTEARDADDPDAPVYRARPPRRNLAITAIVLYSLAEFLLPQSAIGGWLALAAAASVLNLLNDWHVGRPLIGRWPLLLYAAYWLMALGYATIGVALLFDGPTISAGRHLLVVGAMGLSIFAVMCIAGRIHSGYPLDTRSWIPAAAVLIVLAALLRAASGMPGLPAHPLQMASALCWIAAFGLYLRRMGPILLRARVDGGHGCEEVRSVEPARGRAAPM